ncbi:MAG: SDR family NAD(P)-dependent oxidoreductase [Chitinophagales bacterium]|mgnify:CR=1 FL=1
MRDFRNKVIVVTGAGSGMGRAYAIEFAKLGAKLALNDYDKTALDETVSLLPNANAENMLTLAFDVSDKNSMFDFADKVKQKLGNAHIIINNAGIEGSGRPIYLTTVEEDHKIMNINYFGVVHGTKAFLPQIVENNEGAVVNISSIFGLIGTPNNGDYCASKFAVRGFTEALMAEFHESKTISIHCVHPGGIATNIARGENGKEFGKKYLTTPPETIVKHVIESIRQKKSKIVFGNDSFKTWLGSNLVPQGILKGIIWNEIKHVVNREEYRKFIK